MALEIPQIVDLASAFYGSSVLFAALECDLFTAIKEEPTPTIEALVARTQLSPRGLTLLLDAAVAIGLLTKTEGVYGLTPAAALTLVKNAPHDLTRAITYNRDVYQAWGKLTQLVKTGAPVEAPDLHLGDDPERTRRFALSMHARAMAIGQAVVPHLHLPKGAKVLDLAGGPGAYAFLMAKADPMLTCDTYDLPAIATIAKEITAPYADRITCHAGDYHTDTWPEETYDVVTLFGCLHQEAPEMIVDILKRAYAALRPGGLVYVLDMMTGPDHTTPPFSALFAVNMALTTEHGWVFSDAELASWCQAAGFTDFTAAPVPPPMPHMLARAKKA
ncbi:MAG: methyltransferase [bacterium]|nr:methyltransferase [bacterium]